MAITSLVHCRLSIFKQRLVQKIVRVHSTRSTPLDLLTSNKYFNFMFQFLISTAENPFIVYLIDSEYLT